MAPTVVRRAGTFPAYRRATVGEERLSRNEAGIIRKEEFDRGGALVGLAEPPHRDAGQGSPLPPASKRIVRAEQLRFCQA